MAKLNREAKLREKRADKQTRKAARRLSAASGPAEASSRLGEVEDTLAGLDDGTRGASRTEPAAVTSEAGRGT